MSGLSPEPKRAPSTHSAAVCQHSAIQPHFDAAKARTMDVSEVRRTYPRFCGSCPDCGQQVIAYASLEHFVAGDW